MANTLTEMFSGDPHTGGADEPAAPAKPALTLEQVRAVLADNRGMTQNALKCKSNGGTLPLGYFIDHEKHFRIDPATAPIVLEIFTLYADGVSMKEISEQMKMRGIRTRRGGAVNPNFLPVGEGFGFVIYF